MSEEKPIDIAPGPVQSVALAPTRPQYEIPPEISATMPPDRYIAIVSRGDYSGIYGTPQEAAFLFVHALRRGYDPWKNPFQFIVQGKQVTLYAKKEAAIQKKAINEWTVRIAYQGMLRLTYEHVVLNEAGGGQRVELVPKTFDPKFYEVVADVYDAGGVFMEREVGVYPVGEDRSAAMAYTRAKRRAILAAAGESTNDESEFDSPRPNPASRTQETPTRREPSPEPPRSLPVTSATPAGTPFDPKTGEVVETSASVAPTPSQSPSTGILGAGNGATLTPLPRKLPPSKPPIQGIGAK